MSDTTRAEESTSDRVLRVWNRWRETLPLDQPFTHGDGLRFRQMIVEEFAPSNLLAPEPGGVAPDDNAVLKSFDARVWAETWCRIAREIEAANDGRTVIDIEWMTTWFANALMRGYGEHARQHPPTPGLAPLEALADKWDDESVKWRINGHRDPGFLGLRKAINGAMAAVSSARADKLRAVLAQMKGQS